MQQMTYSLPEAFDRETLFKDLQHHFVLNQNRAEVTHQKFLDSFDWRLYKKGWVLEQEGDGFHLYQPGHTGPSNHFQSENGISFAWELPAGELKEIITAVLETRRLLPQAEITTTSTQFHLLNKDEKTVVRFTWHQSRPSTAPEAPPAITYLTVQPVPGHEDEAARLVEELEAAGGTAVAIGDLFPQLMRAAGSEPGNYESKPTLRLAPDLPAHTAVRQLLLADLAIMQINQPYIAQDLDTEFLHDYRVALRRSRSALAQMKGVFAGAKTLAFKTDLKQINTMTNTLRDLDVYLLAEAGYRAMIPDTLQADIDPLFDYLHEKRTAVLAATVEALHSESYRQTMVEWERFLKHPAPENLGPNAHRPILELANWRIYKWYRRILKEGRQILLSEQDEQMHALRIECKKLRYLMEFFITLYPSEDINTLLAQLKILQKNLGDFNDLRVQEPYLLAVAAEIPPDRSGSRRALLAIGALVAHLHAERLRVRAEFADAFAAFSAPDNRKLFKQLFKIKTQAGTKGAAP